MLRPTRLSRSMPAGSGNASRSMVRKWCGTSRRPNQISLNLRQHAPLVGDAVGQDPVERADAVGGDEQQPVAEVIHVADFAAPHGNTGDFATKQNRPSHHISLIVGRTSRKGSLWWKPVPASTVVGQAASLPLLQIRTERNCPSGTPPSLRFRLEAFANSHTRNGKLAARPTFKMAIQQLAPRTNAG